MYSNIVGGSTLLQVAQKAVETVLTTLGPGDRVSIVRHKLDTIQNAAKDWLVKHKPVSCSMAL